MTRNITRIANSDGIIARIRAAPLRKTTRKATKMMATVRPKLSVSVGTRYSPIFAWSSPRPTTRIRQTRSAAFREVAASQASCTNSFKSSTPLKSLPR